MKGKPASFYILYSALIDRYYSGITAGDIQSRVIKHNTSYYGSHLTTQAQDWELRLEITCDSYSMARKIELYVKRMKSRRFIEKIIYDINERDILLAKFKSI